MEKERLYADSELVEWLLFRSGLNKSSIAIGSGLAFSAVSDLKDSVSTIKGARFKSVAKLTSFAQTLQKDTIKINS